MPLEHSTDHAARAPARALQQYKDATAPGVVDVVGDLASETQALEDALFQIVDETSLANAVGVNLDRLGAIVDEPRSGESDSPYWIRIAAKILVNRSTGSIDDLVRIFGSLAPGAVVQVIESFPAKISVKVNGVVVPDPVAFARILRQAKKAGVGTRLEYSTAAAGSGFSFGSVSAPGPGKGFPTNLSLVPPGTGGTLAGVKF